jgi:hypothetical protein
VLLSSCVEHALLQRRSTLVCSKKLVDRALAAGAASVKTAVAASNAAALNGALTAVTWLLMLLQLQQRQLEAAC